MICLTLGLRATYFLYWYLKGWGIKLRDFRLRARVQWIAPNQAKNRERMAVFYGFFFMYIAMIVGIYLYSVAK